MGSEKGKGRRGKAAQKTVSELGSRGAAPGASELTSHSTCVQRRVGPWVRGADAVVPPLGIGSGAEAPRVSQGGGQDVRKYLCI